MTDAAGGQSLRGIAVIGLIIRGVVIDELPAGGSHNWIYNPLGQPDWTAANNNATAMITRGKNRFNSEPSQ